MRAFFDRADYNVARFWQRFRKQYLAIGALLFLLFVAVIALFGDALMPYGITESNFSDLYASPNQRHWLGTDGTGRDILSRVIVGARISLWTAVLAVAISAAVGLPLGLIAGYGSGTVDRVLTWLIDLLHTVPSIILALAVLAVTGISLTNAMIAIGIGMSTQYARLTRTAVINEQQKLYVDSARVAGYPAHAILLRQILPNLTPALIVQTTLLLGTALLIEASLGFLGIGVDVNQPSWGRMLAEAGSDMLVNPWIAVPPGLALALTVLAWNLLGDGLHDSFGRELSHNALTGNRSTMTRWYGDESYMSAETATRAALMLNHIEVRFPGDADADRLILEDVTYAVLPGKTLGIVGESGAGKSMAALAALGLVPAPGKITAGQVYLNGRDITQLPESVKRLVRGAEIAMVFQETIASLNPTATIGAQLMQPMQLHLGLSKEAARERAIELLAMVQMPHPAQHMDEYPHQMSQGFAQRVCIARAISCNPTVLIADEPTIELDGTVEAHIIDLLRELQQQLGLAIVFISHNLSVVAEIADSVAVMYAGQVVESGPTKDLFDAPQHPYTKALLSTLPHHKQLDGRLPTIAGIAPSPANRPSGCRFHPRCKFAVDACRERVPAMHELSNVRFSRCLRIGELDFMLPKKEQAWKNDKS